MNITFDRLLTTVQSKFALARRTLAAYPGHLQRRRRSQMNVQATHTFFWYQQRAQHICLGRAALNRLCGLKQSDGLDAPQQTGK